MEEVKTKKRNTYNSSNKSNIVNNNQKKKRVQKKPSSLSNEEILEQILAKKKQKKNDINKAKVILPKLKKIDTRSNEEILDEILSKKRRKKVKGVVPSTDVDYGISVKAIESSKKELQSNQHDVDNHILLQEIIEAVKKDELQTKEKHTFFFKKKAMIGIFLFIFVLFVGISIFFLNKEKSFQFTIPNHITITYDNRPLLFESCMKEDISFDLSDELNELESYLETNYNASISYEDITTSFGYYYQSDQLYYAASTIKALDALYIYTYAITGDINLDTTLVYSSKYQRVSSKGVSRYKYGSKISLRELVQYAVMYSDNSAHAMLYDYIGHNNLRDFGIRIGATNALSFSDPFGYLTSKDGLAIMKSVHNFTQSQGELGEELQSYFLNAEQNDLEISSLNIKAAHKYGEYDSMYHDMGIVYDEHPYVVAIFTSEGNKKNHEDIIRDINSHVYQLHKSLYEEKEMICRNRVYQ